MTAQQLHDCAIRFNDWLHKSALPLWWERGSDPVGGGFHELLGLDGSPVPGVTRRARVQSRQSYSYALASELGWNGPWRRAAPYGIDYLIRHYRKKDGQFCTLVSARGEILDSTTMLYDQAFALLAMAAVFKVLPERTDLRDMAHTLFAGIRTARQHSTGGFVETGERAFISNPHMHLLEALLAWGEVEPATIWDRYADHIVGLCRTKFIDAEGGFLREHFDKDWNPAPGALGHVVEPGHQFEWAWLLARWGKMRGEPDAILAARRLFENGLRGVDPKRDAAVHALTDDFSVTQPSARLWAQTERIKAALILAEPGDDRLLKEALKGAACLWRYLDTPLPGLWRDKFEPDGTFVEEPAPASSFYHIICCIACLNEAVKAL
jgi:mannose/cellobiose epimerase-like protein (N-acyl-D-glucosamine 2-epimerase family)